jgi:hypothetical protein
MKGLTAALTASRLEQMLAFYMKSEDRSDQESEAHAVSDHAKPQHEHRDIKAETAHPRS